MKRAHLHLLKYVLDYGPRFASWQTPSKLLGKLDRIDSLWPKAFGPPLAFNYPSYGVCFLKTDPRIQEFFDP